MLLFQTDMPTRYFGVWCEDTAKRTHYMEGWADNVLRCIRGTRKFWPHCRIINIRENVGPKLCDWKLLDPIPEYDPNVQIKIKKM